MNTLKKLLTTEYNSITEIVEAFDNSDFEIHEITRYEVDFLDLAESDNLLYTYELRNVEGKIVFGERQQDQYL